MLLGFVYQPPPDVDMLISCADVQMRMGLFAAARDFTAKVLVQDSDHIQALLMDAYCAERTGRDEEALRRYTALFERVSHPDQLAELCISQALLLCRTGEPQKGIEVLRKASPLDPAIQAKLDLARGLCWESGGQQGVAAGLFRHVLDLPEAPADVLFRSSRRLEEMGCVEEALRGFGRGAEEGDLEAKFRFSRLKFFCGDADTASAVLREIADADSRFLKRLLREDEAFRNEVQSNDLLPGGKLGAGGLPDRGTSR